MGEGTTPGWLEKSLAAAAAAAAVAIAAGTGALTGRLAGMAAEIETLRATRTRKPARSISISVRLVSSSSSASSRISALSSLGNLPVILSSGWGAMMWFRNSAFEDWERKRQALGLAATAPILAARP